MMTRNHNMPKQYSLSLHIFRRDLRLHDNTALIESLKSSQTVIPCFIFDKRQIENNDYKSNNCLQFMAHSLQELDAELKKKNSQLYCFYGIAEEIIVQLIKKLNIQAVYLNRDYTPFSRTRDQNIQKVCHQFNVDFYCYADALLHEPEAIRKVNQEPYNIFTHFYKKSLQLPVQPPLTNPHQNFYQKAIQFTESETLAKLLKINNPRLLLKGGRAEALSLLQEIHNLSAYAQKRNFPALQSTTHLSAHNKFGTLSIREVYAEIVKNFGKNHSLLSELYWRDFFTHIAFNYSHVFSRSFHQKYANIAWSKNEESFAAWCEGKTGFPIVDAGMRELNATGYMHNRVRMIVASFLTKDLHIDWRWGEKYFAQKLIDYDPSVNNGNWQWAASTGCDAQPYFRIFNPWLQQQKFDPHCAYIKKWVPELAAIPPKMLHHLSNVKENKIAGYPEPMLDHAVESQKAKLAYKSVV